ncbi:MAG: RDD family protein [Acidobacteria bacterium]|nr:RDD family protein [Acidobacteriota bacterium]MDW7984860.1 RDD family protein [Acidobacteriota bacterium]
MRCPQCHAIHRPEAATCFRCGRRLISPSPGPSDTPVWLWQEKAHLLERLRHVANGWSSWTVWARRLVAAAVDQLMVVGIFGLVVLAAVLLTDFPVGPTWRHLSFRIQVGLVFLLLHFLYTFVFQVFLSATPGYWLLGLAVAPTVSVYPWMAPGRVAARWLCLWVLMAFGGLSFWWSLLDRRHWFLHDRLTGTRPIPQAEYQLRMDLLLKE